MTWSCISIFRNLLTPFAFLYGSANDVDWWFKYSDNILFAILGGVAYKCHWGPDAQPCQYCSHFQCTSWFCILGMYCNNDRGAWGTFLYPYSSALFLHSLRPYFAYNDGLNWDVLVLRSLFPGEYLTLTTPRDALVLHSIYLPKFCYL